MALYTRRRITSREGRSINSCLKKMFGKIGKHYKRAVAFGKGAINFGQRVYNKGVHYAHQLDQALNIARQGVEILRPMAGDVKYGSGILDTASAGIDKIRGMQERVRHDHDHVMNKIRQGGEVLQKLRNIDPGAKEYAM